jgi:hypothetical protein
MSYFKQWSVYPVSNSNCWPQIVSGYSEDPQVSRQYPRHYTFHPILSHNILQQIDSLLDGINSRLLAGRPNSRVSVPARDKRFFFFQSPDRLQATSPSILFSWYSCQVKQPDLEADYLPPLRITSSSLKYPHGAVCIAVRRNNLTLPSQVNFCKNQKRGNEEMGFLLGPVHLFGLITVLRFLGNCRHFMWRPMNHNVHRSYNIS